MATEVERDTRYEIKMIANRAAYHEILHALRLDPSGIRVLYPPRRIQSIYLDTLDQNALQENLAGISHREKLRFRWYGDDVRGVQGKLERKVRHNALGWKDIAVVDKAMDVEGNTRRRFMEELLGGLPEDWSGLRDENLGPVQWICYWREYFSTADGRVRVTVDRDLKTYDQRHRYVLSNAFASVTPDVTIVEAKCAKENHDEAKRILNRFPAPIDKCSKFVLASDPADAPGVAIFEE